MLSRTLAASCETSILDNHKIAVLIPCHNEQSAIGDVVAAVRNALSSAAVYVYDNNSTDRTAEVAHAAGAVVRSERLQGKGHVVRRMFADIDADIYLLVDGDGTYDVPSARMMIERLLGDNLDMVVGARVNQGLEAYRRGHRTGNRLLTGFVSLVFGGVFTDMLSGYRVFSRRFVKSFPLLSSGFEIETELTIHALEMKLPVAEVQTPYYARLEGSVSKLNTWADGLRILWTIVLLYKSERPFHFFSIAGGAFALMSVILAIPLFVTYLEEGVVPRMPTAVLTTGMMLAAFLLEACGLILSTVTLGRREMKRLTYLQQK
jgi:glycosyltransferase involved in cell wall biosynthesis